MTLSEYIGEVGITTITLAVKLGVSQPFVSQLATGRRRPSPEVAKRISEATGGKVTVMELLYPKEADAEAV